MPSFFSVSMSPAQRKFTYRLGKIADTVHAINRSNIEEVVASTDFNTQQSIDHFYQVLHEVEDLYQPVKTAKAKNDKPGMTPEIKKLIIKRQQAFCNSQDDGKPLAACIKWLIRAKKRAYERRFTMCDFKV